jgi:hypothetical protein
MVPGTGKGGRCEWLTARERGIRCFAQIEAYLSCDRLLHLLPLAPYAGAGGARSPAISDRISANICRDTATSASWKVT